MTKFGGGMRTRYGFTLIEVLISLLLLSLMLLGLDAMQITSLREANAAYYFATATQQLEVMGERLKLSNVEEQLNLWNKQNAEILPQGFGMISGDYPVYTVSIFWGKQENQHCEKNKIGKSGCLRAVVDI